jgi:eukaryotic-like serine/threonine-protein kinase
MYIEHGNKIILISVIASLATAIVVALIFWFFTTNTEIPDVTGKSAELAKAILEAKGLRVYQEDSVYDPAIPEGSVVKQDRVPGERVRKGGLVKIILSKGPEQILVPYLIKVPLAEAQAQLEKLGLKMGRVTPAASESVATDCIISTFPAQNTAVPRGSSVDLVVSGGAVEVVMPRVTGRGLSSARDELEKLGLKVNVRYATSEDLDPGIVMRQNPEPNAKAKKGDTVDLWVSYEEE